MRWMSTLSDNLKYYRKLSGLTVRELTEKTGIPQQTYTGWELGNRQPRHLDDLDKVAEVFGITKDYLLYENGKTITIEVKEKRSDKDRERLLRSYSALNDEARMKIVEYAEDLLGNEKYRN